MPVYEYECSECGEFSASRPMAQYREPQACPQCGRACERAMLTAPAFAGMPAVTRTALTINEKAKHEPLSSKEYAATRHGAGCGCCGTKSMPSRTVKAKDGSKAFPTARPWMISH